MYDSGGFDEKTRVTDGISFKPAGPTNDALVLIYPPGPDMGRKYKLDANVVNLGRDSSNQIVVNSDSVSRRHARLTIESGQRMITDLQSTNGTYINNMPILSHFLKNGDQLKIGETIFKYLVGSDVESAYHEEIYTMTIKDGLTEIYNKRYFEEALERELSRAQRHRRKLSILIFDIDFFKKVNDTFGHLAGDYVLRELAAIIAKRSRHEEVFARYGGEEFVILLPESNNAEALTLADQLRRLVEKHRFIFEGEKIPVTISIGVMTTDGGEKLTSAEFIKAADEQLYVAKSQGRNCVRSKKNN
jgi:two-component system, cell cycle response regulator